MDKLAPYAENYEKIKQKGILLDKEIEYLLIQNCTIPSNIIDDIKDALENYKIS